MTKKLLFFSRLLNTVFAVGQKNMLQKDKEAVDTLFFSDLDLALELSEKNIPIALAINDTVFVTYSIIDFILTLVPYLKK